MFRSGSSFIDDIPPVVKNLLIINILFWFASLTLTGRFDINYYLGLHYWGASMFNPAQMVTYMFMHANFWHLFFNMFGLYMFGRILEQVLGPKRFLFYYFITGIGAALIQQLVWTIEIHPILESVSAQMANGAPPELLEQKEALLNQFTTIGASGAIFGLLLAFGMLFPNQPLFLMFIPIPIKAKYFVVGYAVFELFFGVANSSTDNVAHFAHLGGMLFGFLVILYWKKKSFN